MRFLISRQTHVLINIFIPKLTGRGPPNNALKLAKISRLSRVEKVDVHHPVTTGILENHGTDSCINHVVNVMNPIISRPQYYQKWVVNIIPK